MRKHTGVRYGSGAAALRRIASAEHAITPLRITPAPVTQTLFPFSSLSALGVRALPACTTPLHRGEQLECLLHISACNKCAATMTFYERSSK